MEISTAATALETFINADLTQTLSRIESSLRGATLDKCSSAVETFGAGNNVLAAASVIKQLAGQINVVIHALGILICLPQLLEPGEIVDYVSLGAGNTGRMFDLETNRRIAEFKFINWQGGSETIRQNALFKDFYLMAEHDTAKKKFLYVLGTEYPLRFLNGGRALSSVLSRNVSLHTDFVNRFGAQYIIVRDYFLSRRDTVVVQDISQFLPDLKNSVED